MGESRNAVTELEESIEQFWELRSSGQLDPCVHPGEHLFGFQLVFDSSSFASMSSAVTNWYEPAVTRGKLLRTTSRKSV